MTLDNIDGDSGNRNCDNGDAVIVLYLKKGLRHLSQNEAFFYLVIKVNSHLECCNIDRFYHPIFFSCAVFLFFFFAFQLVIRCDFMSPNEFALPKTHTHINAFGRPRGQFWWRLNGIFHSIRRRKCEILSQSNVLIPFDT